MPQARTHRREIVRHEKLVGPCIAKKLRGGERCGGSGTGSPYLQRVRSRLQAAHSRLILLSRANTGLMHASKYPY